MDDWKEQPCAYGQMQKIPLRACSGSHRPGAGRAWLVTMALLCALLGGLGGGALCASYFTVGIERNTVDNAVPATTQTGTFSSQQKLPQATQRDTTLLPSTIYTNNVPGVVSINAVCAAQDQNAAAQTVACGSGFVIDSQGYLVTNYHVVDATSDIMVTFYTGQQYPAAVAGFDAENDIAVLKIEAVGLTMPALGDSSKVSVGEQVCTIGNPLGELSFAMTVGYISALDRQVETKNGAILSMLQTDCAINSGNSGGPLFDSRGKVIGIVSAKCSDDSVENVGFAIPIQRVMQIVSDILKTTT